MNHKFSQQKIIINLLINILKKKKKWIMMNIKMKNRNEYLKIFYNLVLMTKMTILLVFRRNKYRVKPFSQRQNKKLNGTLLQLITKTLKNQWYNCIKKCVDEIEQRMKAKKPVLFLKREQVKNQIQNLGWLHQYNSHNHKSHRKLRTRKLCKNQKVLSQR